MNDKLTFAKLDLGKRFSEEEMRNLIGGDYYDPVYGWIYDPGVTVYGSGGTGGGGGYYDGGGGYYDGGGGYYDGGGNGGGYSGDPGSYPDPTNTGNGGGGGGVGGNSGPGGPGDHHVNTARLPVAGNSASTQVPGYCVYQTIENALNFFGKDVNPGTIAGKAVQITNNTQDWLNFDGNVSQLNQLISTYLEGNVTSDIKKSIDASNPVLAYMNNGDGTGHDVMITGYNNDGTYSYFDPQASKYLTGTVDQFNDPFAVTGLKP